ncbi:MAG: hypothetical protein JNG89_03195, partial [Planctomycetaceae bacterium]|nr:hypothetical protein [Planctomycetaceae bacterium]
MSVNLPEHLDAVSKLITALASLAGACSTLPLTQKRSSLSSRLTSDELTKALKATNLPADIKQSVVSAVTSMRRRLTALSWTFFLTFALVLISWLIQPESFAALSQSLSHHDPGVFSHSSDGLYDIARIITNRSDLESETDLSETLRHTKASFDVMTTGGGLFVHYKEDFADAVRRGVHVRVVLLDTGPATSGFYDAVVGIQDRQRPTEERTKAERTKAIIDELAGSKDNKGTIQLKWLDIPMVKAFWVADSSTDHGIAHVSSFSYDGPESEMC